MKKSIRGPALFILLIIMFVLAVQFFTGGFGQNIVKIDYSAFQLKVQEKEVSDVAIVERNLFGIEKGSLIKPEELPGKYDFTTYIPPVDQFYQDMRIIASRLTGKPVADIAAQDFGFNISFLSAEQPWYISMLPLLLFAVLIIGFFWYISSKQAQSGNQVFSFGKSRARMNVSDKNKKTFADVAGADEEKEELNEIVEFLRSPKKFLELGARIPKGILLVGPPGTGKTLLAKAVAGEAGVPFFSISGSDFVEMFVGVGASRVRDLFETAKKNSPCIVFIDEIDAVGRHRGAGLGGGHDEREQTLNQLLVEMDGFSVNEGIIILAATNRPDILDPALLRPGRFDRQITVNIPDIKGREEILKVHSRGKPLDSDVDLKTVAKRTIGFTGADLENALNEAAILTARRNKNRIGMSEIEESITRVVAGPEKRSLVFTEKDKRCTAYHEIGHAVVAKMLPNCDPVHEVSVVPRGSASGYTMTLPKEDDRHVFKSKLLDMVAMLLGGRATEQLLLGDISTGAQNDLKRATEIVRRMVVEFGMSDKLGPVYLGGDHEIFIGRDYGQQRIYSEDVAAAIDGEIKKIMDEAYKRAEDIIKANVSKIHKLAEVLLQKEKLNAEEFEEQYANA
ncbi:MAG: ATP-dependent zinc metalloprotease FtsH [Bacillota bacterium]|nr:ATP-dependent zinc metalloprotease FtsH [Bacillota bacterium]